MCNIFFCGLTAFRKMNGLVKTLGMKLGFESFVNSEECKTPQALARNSPWFESFVNSEECKTLCISRRAWYSFESFVNSEECKTAHRQVRLTWAFESFVNSEECKTSQIVPLSLILFESFVNSEEYNKGRPVYRFLVSWQFKRYRRKPKMQGGGKTMQLFIVLFVVYKFTLGLLFDISKNFK